MSTDVFTLRNVDYSEKGVRLEIVVEGQRKLQTVIYAGVDHQGEKWYYTQEGHQFSVEVLYRTRRARKYLRGR
jgi:hypothetical protein